MDISVFFTSDLTSSERRVSPQWKLSYLKEKLEQITGIPCAHQELQYHPYNSSNEYVVLTAPDESAVTIADLGIASFSRIHVHDTDANSQLRELADDKEAPQFQLSEEAYQKRNDSVLQWKKENRLGRFDASYEAKLQQLEELNSAAAEKINVGDRCRIIGISGERRGSVGYVGKIQSLGEGKTVWVGVEFDEPVGKNDGTLDGVRYFSCKPGYGSFVPPHKVEVGDFPEEDLLASDDEEL